MARKDVAEEEWQNVLKDIDRILSNPEEANRRVDQGVEGWLRKRRGYGRYSKSTKSG